MNFGVSPAWFLSLYGEGFTVAQAMLSLEILRKLGFTNWQPEIVLDESINEWVSGKHRNLRDRSLNLGLKSDTFVAHFLGPGFTAETVRMHEDADKLRQVLQALESWPEISAVSIPLPPAPGGTGLLNALADKLSFFASLVQSAGRVLAIEPMPGNLAGKSTDISELLRRDELINIGINYDTGHFHAAGESQEHVHEELGKRFVCTHLCDNDGITNLSLPPGDGTVPWEAVTGGLSRIGYRGSWDIEIRCPADQVEEAYTRGRKHIESFLLKESA